MLVHRLQQYNGPFWLACRQTVCPLWYDPRVPSAAGRGLREGLDRAPEMP